MNSHRMKAQVLERPNRMIYREVDVPTVGPDDVLLRVRVCGISEMDRRLYEGECSAPEMPVVLGQEVLGTVESMGAAVRGLEIGDRVSFDSGFQLGAHVYEKRQGQLRQLDETRPCLGLMGGFAEYMLAPAGRCFRTPDQVDDYTAALAGSIVHELRALRGFRETLQENAPMGASCVISGSRAGLLLTALVRFLGFAPVIVVGAGEENLDASSRMGADVTIDRERVRDVAAAAAKALDGLGADVLIDVDGGGCVSSGCEQLLAEGGRLYSLMLPDSTDLAGPADMMEPADKVFAAVFKLLRYERLNPRPAYTMAVPLENVEWAVREWRKDVRLLKAFMASALREDFYFEHYRSPVDATLYEK